MDVRGGDGAGRTGALDGEDVDVEAVAKLLTDIVERQERHSTTLHKLTETVGVQSEALVRVATTVRVVVDELEAAGVVDRDKILTCARDLKVEVDVLARQYAELHADLERFERDSK